MKQALRLFFLLLLACSFVSCNSDDDKDKTKTFVNDPNQPGANPGAGAIRAVFNVQVCPNLLDATCTNNDTEFDNLKITWRIPSLYETEEYVVVIYKVDAEQYPDTNIINRSPGSPLPPDLANITFEQVRVKDSQWTDTQVLQNKRYHYWIYLVYKGKGDAFSEEGQWSTSVKQVVQTPLEGGSTNLGDADKFWEKIRWKNLTSPPAGTNGEIITYNSLSPGASTPQQPKGRIEVAYNGAAFFVSDTDNNRVLVYQNDQLKICEQYLEDDLQYFACRLQADGNPPTAYNILGQPSQSSKLSCVEHNTACNAFTTQADCNLTRNGIRSFCQWNSTAATCAVKGNECLTKPTDLLFSQGKLIVSDSGNDRVVMYNDAEFRPSSTGAAADKVLIGCDNRLPQQAIDSNPIKCNFDKIFGKKDFNDFASYDITDGSGISSLKYPTGLAIDGNDLYIADTGNHRVVKTLNYAEATAYTCNESNWLTQLCRWKGLLGQKDYFSRKSLQDFYNEDPLFLGGTFNNEIQNENLMKRYFANPSKIVFYNKNEQKYMFIGSNENFEATVGLGTKVAIKGRIIRFDGNPLDVENPICNDATFDNGFCDATEVMGQDGFNKLVVLSGSSGGAGQYSNLGYGIEDLADFEIVETKLMAIDAKNNHIYTWDDFINKVNNGFPYSYKVIDPAGRYVSASLILPDLKRLLSISYDAFGAKLYIVDGLDSKVYQLDLAVIPFE